MMQGPFWIAALQIIFVNLILSGDNAVVIAMACLRLPQRQRRWGMILGTGGALLFYVAIKLVTEEAGDEDEGVQSARTIWRAVWIVSVADIVMSLDNVIA